MSWDDIHAGARFIREQQALSRQLQDETRRLNEETSALNQAWARLDMATSRLGAVETIVKNSFPDHPYFSQIEAIRQAGRIAGHGRSTDDSYAAGANFPLPPYTPPNQEADRLRRENKNLTQQLLTAGLELNALRGECRRLKEELSRAAQVQQQYQEELGALQRDCVHHVALHHAYREELFKVAPGHVLLMSLERRQELAEKAYELFVEQRDWEAVKEFGRNYTASQEPDGGLD